MEQRSDFSVSYGPDSDIVKIETYNRHTVLSYNAEGKVMRIDYKDVKYDMIENEDGTYELKILGY